MVGGEKLLNSPPSRNKCALNFNRGKSIIDHFLLEVAAVFL